MKNSPLNGTRTLYGVFVDLGPREVRRPSARSEDGYKTVTVHHAKCGMCRKATLYDIGLVASMLAHIETHHEATGQVERYVTGDGEIKFRPRVR